MQVCFPSPDLVDEFRATFTFGPFPEPGAAQQRLELAERMTADEARRALDLQCRRSPLGDGHGGIGLYSPRVKMALRGRM